MEDKCVDRGDDMKQVYIPFTTAPACATQHLTRVLDVISSISDIRPTVISPGNRSASQEQCFHSSTRIRRVSTGIKGNQIHQPKVNRV